MRQHIFHGVAGNTLQKKVHDAAVRRITKNSQIAELIAISQDEKRFDETMEILKETLARVASPEEVKKCLGNGGGKFVDFDTSGARWHILKMASRKVADEIHLMDKKKREKFLKTFPLDGSRTPCLQLSAFHLMDLDTTEEHLTTMFQDAEEKRDWRLIGSTLGRLALDPKLSLLALRLSKQWLTLRGQAKVRLLEKDDQIKAEEEIQQCFLYYVTRGRQQERVLRDLAVYYRGQKNLALAECFWKAYRTYSGSKFGDLVYDEMIGSEDVAVIANTLTTIEEISTLLLALRNQFFDAAGRRIIDTLVGRALSLDDKECSYLKKVVESLYAAHFNNFADDIRLKVSRQRK